MKKTDSFMKVVVFVLCAVMVLYVGFSILRAPRGGYSTYKAVHYEVGDGISTSGFLVRDEKLILSNKSIVVMTCKEGDRIGAGQRVANSYNDEEARRRQLRISELEAELAQMEYAYSYSGSDNITLDADIVKGIQSVNTMVVRQDFSGAAAPAEQLKSYVLRRHISAADAETLWERIQQTRQLLDSLRAEGQDTAEPITVDVPGYFSTKADGYEAILDSSWLDLATAADVDELSTMRVSTPSNAVGRLATASRWYYVTVVDSDSVSELRENSYISVQFVYDFYDSISMRVARIGRNEDGRRVLVLTSDQYIQKAVSGRQQKAELVFGSRSGLRIPKTALYVNEDGQPGVYVLEGIRAVWKPVTPIYDSGEYQIVREDKSSTGNLWPGDEVILTTDPIFHGKVMGE